MIRPTRTLKAGDRITEIDDDSEWYTVVAIETMPRPTLVIITDGGLEVRTPFNYRTDAVILAETATS